MELRAYTLGDPALVPLAAPFRSGDEVDAEKTGREIDLEFREWAAEQESVTRCAFCRSVFRGTIAEGREWSKQHRADRHGIRPKKTRARPKEHGEMTMVSRESFDENLKRARSAGAGHGKQRRCRNHPDMVAVGRVGRYAGLCHECCNEAAKAARRKKAA